MQRQCTRSDRMPNWTKVKVIFFNKEDADRFIKYDAKEGERVFSFESIVPSPKTEEECKKIYPSFYNKNGFKGIEPLEDRPWFHWYNWNYIYWGTKWDACDSEYVDNGVIELTFYSAWCYPEKVMDAMIHMTKGRVEITYADEDYNDTWHMTYVSGELRRKWMNYDECGMEAI